MKLVQIQALEDGIYGLGDDSYLYQIEWRAREGVFDPMLPFEKRYKRVWVQLTDVTTEVVR